MSTKLLYTLLDASSLIVLASHSLFQLSSTNAVLVALLTSVRFTTMNVVLAGLTNVRPTTMSAVPVATRNTNTSRIVIPDTTTAMHVANTMSVNYASSATLKTLAMSKPSIMSVDPAITRKSAMRSAALSLD